MIDLNVEKECNIKQNIEENGNSDNKDFKNQDDHAKNVDEKLVCLICYDDINESNYIEYQINEFSEWYPGLFCLDCTNILIKTQYNQYIKNVQKSECLKEQTALLKMGPPINVKDPNGFPFSNNNEIYSLWYFNDKKVHSAKLEGSLIGEERIQLWDELKKFLITDKKD